MKQSALIILVIGISAVVSLSVTVGVIEYYNAQELQRMEQMKTEMQKSLESAKEGFLEGQQQAKEGLEQIRKAFEELKNP